MDSETVIVKAKVEQLHGKLLWAEDSSLVLWRSEEPYNWKTIAHDASVVPVTSISSIRVERQGGFSTGARIGAYAGIAGSIIYTAINYQEHKRDLEAFGGYFLVAGTFTALCSIAGGIIGSIIQQDYQATIDGKVENYLPAVNTLSESSIIESYPPPELVRLINK